jgi:hypothetical protein
MSYPTPTSEPPLNKEKSHIGTDNPPSSPTPLLIDWCGRVIALPVTHRQPEDPTTAVEMPQIVISTVFTVPFCASSSGSEIGPDSI